MEDLIKFSKQLQDLIAENAKLKEELRERDETLKLAICLKGALDFRSTDKVNQEAYESFLNDTGVLISSDGLIRMFWKPKVNSFIGDSGGLGLKKVTIEDIQEIFNTETE